MINLNAIVYRDESGVYCAEIPVDRVLIPCACGADEVDESKPLPKNLCEIARRTICSYFKPLIGGPCGT